jgi:hypothetical protein
LNYFWISETWGDRGAHMGEGCISSHEVPGFTSLLPSYIGFVHCSFVARKWSSHPCPGLAEPWCVSWVTWWEIYPPWILSTSQCRSGNPLGLVNCLLRVCWEAMEVGIGFPFP